MANLNNNNTNNINKFNANKFKKYNTSLIEKDKAHAEAVLKMLTNYAWQYKNWLQDLDETLAERAVQDFNYLMELEGIKLDEPKEKTDTKSEK